MSHASEEENYWPGYVDALTAMVQVLAFVMMMLAMAVFVLSQSVTKKAVEVIAKAANVEVKPGTNAKDLTNMVVEQIQRNQSSPPPAATDSKPKPDQSANAQEASTEVQMTGMRVKNTRSPTAVQTTKPASDSPQLTLNFADRSFNLDSGQMQSINKFLSEGKSDAPRVIIIAWAYSGDGALSEARRLAYYRAMVVRRQLIEDKIKPGDIQVTVQDTADKAKGSTVESFIGKDGGK